MPMILRMLLVTLALVKLTASAPKTWPYMKNYDIWETNKTNSPGRPTFGDNSHYNSLFQERISHSSVKVNSREAKVINFFSLPVDDECLSDDGRRLGLCINVYECRIQGGTSRGDCALGFGSCCVFESTCNEEVRNNITYFVSPKFPAVMPFDKENCSVTIKLISDDISQIRLDFVHFTLGQPNRMTGVCENDVLTIEGGTSPFALCGQNSGQHVFYDIGSPKARATPQQLKININLNKRSVATRLWEIRIIQIPFSYKVPAGCMQYFTGSEGIIQTFNYADNGRHLANQNYKSCVRQEKGLCSIQYEPCDDQSFRIGPLSDNGMLGMPGDPTSGSPGSVNDPALNDVMFMDPALDPALDPTLMDGLAGAETASDGTQAADETQQQDEELQDEQAEGSGGDAGGSFFGGLPVFSLPSLFRTFSGGRQARQQLYSPCTDRITLPCIVEDFIDAGMGNVPSCLPVHCGNSFCQAGVLPCRVETSVTPFHIGVHFGDGNNNKGSPENNIGACLRYRQLPCS